MKAEVGDLVEYGKEEFLAIKVNEKSVYVCKNINFLSLWRDKPTGMTWKAMCDREHAKKVNPELLKIKQKGLVKIETKQSKKGKVVSTEGEKILKESFERFKKKVEGKKTKATSFVYETAKEKIFPLAANVEKSTVLFRNFSTNTYHFFNVETGVYNSFNKDKYKEKILWP